MQGIIQGWKSCLLKAGNEPLAEGGWEEGREREVREERGEGRGRGETEERKEEKRDQALKR